MAFGTLLSYIHVSRVFGIKCNVGCWDTITFWYEYKSYYDDVHCDPLEGTIKVGYRG